MKDDFINLPQPMNTYAMTLCSLNIYDAPMIGAKVVGVVPDRTRVAVIDFKISKNAGKIFMLIGGCPEQWITAYHNNKMQVRFLGEL